MEKNDLRAAKEFNQRAASVEYHIKNGPESRLDLIEEHHPSWLVRTAAKLDKRLGLSDDIYKKANEHSHDNKPAPLSWLMRAAAKIGRAGEAKVSDFWYPAKEEIFYPGEHYHGDPEENRDISYNAAQKAREWRGRLTTIASLALNDAVDRLTVKEVLGKEKEFWSEVKKDIEAVEGPWRKRAEADAEAQNQYVAAQAAKAGKSPGERLIIPANANDFRNAAIMDVPDFLRAAPKPNASEISWMGGMRVHNPATGKADLSVLRTVPINDRDRLVELADTIRKGDWNGAINLKGRGAFIAESVSQPGHYYLAIPTKIGEQPKLLEDVENALSSAAAFEAVRARPLANNVAPARPRVI